MPTLPKGAYCIVDDSAGQPPAALVAELVAGGAAVVQLRFKHLGAGALLRAACAAKLVCAGRAVLLINDRPDVARLSGADGVHLGQDDLPVAEARKLLGPAAIIGLSTHSDAELDASDGADYVGFGPVFATGSKPGRPLPPPHGLDGLRRAVHRARVPLVAIGGITAGNVRAVAETGAHGAASIAELSAHPERVGAFAEAFR